MACANAVRSRSALKCGPRRSGSTEREIPPDAPHGPGTPGPKSIQLWRMQNFAPLTYCCNEPQEIQELRRRPAGRARRLAGTARLVVPVLGCDFLGARGRYAVARLLGDAADQRGRDP